MRTCLLVNPYCGGWQRYERFLRQLSVAAGVPLRTMEEPLRQLLGKVCGEGFERLIVAGGDGTLSRVVNALGPHLSAVELAVIPIGTGNDLARALGVNVESVQEAWQLALHGRAYAADLIRATDGRDKLVLNAATGGFGGKVSTDVRSEDKQRWGAVAYWMTAFSQLVHLSAYEVQLELDDQVLTQSVYGLAIANGRYVGGGFPVAPQARLDDGCLVVVTIPVLPTTELLAAGFDYVLGRQPAAHRVQTYQSRHVHLHAEPDLPFSLDGEPTRSMDATFEVVPRAIRWVMRDQARDRDDSR